MELVNNGDPPDAAAYQSTVSPDNTLVVIVGIASPVQYCWSPPLTGGDITGQLQSGAVTGNVFWQLLPSVTVSVISVPDAIELIVQTFPLVLTTVPLVLVTVPVLTVTTTV